MNLLNNRKSNNNRFELSILVPCFNEAENIDEFYKRINIVLEKLYIQNYQIIFIDDGSKDNTWKKINEKYSDNNKRVIGIKLSKNFGHQNAILSGLEYCKGKYVLFIDCDLQDPPELLEKMYTLIKSNENNIVSCQRNTRQDSFFKKISAKIFYFIFNILSYTKIQHEVSDFRIIDSKVLDVLKKFKEQEPFIRGLISWPGFKEEKIYFDRQARNKGKSGWTLSKMFNFSLNAFFGFSNYPMRLSFLICFSLIIIFLILAVYTIYGYIYHQNVKGWTSIFLAIILFNIFNFFILGLISEYTGRIYFEVKKRPRFIIEKEIK